MYFLGGRAGGTGWDGCPRSTYGSDVPTPRIVPFVVAFGPPTDPLTMLAANSAASPLRKPSMAVCCQRRPSHIGADEFRALREDGGVLATLEQIFTLCHLG